LLPHFGSAVRGIGIGDAGRLAEAAGFDSVWVRDHVVYRPHSWEDQDRSFIDPFLALAAVGSVTTRPSLGLSVLSPFRHPIHAARSLASLDHLSGGGRVIAGIGLGNDRRGFRALGLDKRDRARVFEEYVAIVHGLLAAGPITWHGEYFDFEEVAIQPTPIAPIPIWYGAPSRQASMDRVVRLCDGVFLATTYDEFARRRDALAASCEAARRPLPTLAANVLVVPLSDGERLDSFIDLARVPWTSGATAGDDYGGALIAGSAEQIVRGVRAWLDLGCEHFVFNLRLRHADYRPMIELLGERVLPELRLHAGLAGPIPP
jgi:alkanesulfonate monooxygenase SsuD/methylene tetrahydromethanopterin reductase-like flavin-dependent oxidoreductase (luciferase family)